MANRQSKCDVSELPARCGGCQQRISVIGTVVGWTMVLLATSSSQIVRGDDPGGFESVPETRQHTSRGDRLAAFEVESSHPAGHPAATNPLPTDNLPAAVGGPDADADLDIAADLDSLLDADLQTLRDTRVSAPDMSMEVTSIARTEVSVGKTPAAVFVITQEMIRRSGARTLPDVLRMAPGLHVARSSNGQWSIGVRGSAGLFEDSLLVQVDGRSIYTPAFGGVSWQVRNIVLADIERIEIIRGPGASVWGANAVNGVINIVTKHTRDTLGTLVEGAAGDELRYQGTARYGGQSGKYKSWRVWGQQLEEDGGLLLNGTDEIGIWRSNQVGFRIDRETEYFDEHTISGGLVTTAHDIAATRPTLVPPTYLGAVQSRDNLENLYLSSHRRKDLGGNDSFEVQSFVDLTEQDSFDFVHYRLLVADVGFQHHVESFDSHNVVWGANYRLNHIYELSNSFQVTTPGQFHYNLASLFFQDTIELADDVDLTLGSKFSWNDLTDFEIQPTARIVWSPSQKTSLWASVSRAVRLPSFLDTIVNFRAPLVATMPLPTFPVEIANPNLDAETLIAVEAGFRTQPSRNFFWDTAFYYFFSDNEITSGLNGTTQVVNPPGFVNLLAPRFNRLHGVSSGGFETILRYDVADDWSVSGNYSLAITENRRLNRYPANMIYLQSSHELCEDLELDLIWRYTDLTDGTNLPAYDEMDVRLSYRISDNCELSLVGRNLLDAAHPEDTPNSAVGNVTTQTERGIFGLVRLTY